MLTLLFNSFLDLKACVSAPCQNIGLCEVVGDGYHCNCGRHFTGHHCETGTGMTKL